MGFALYMIVMQDARNSVGNIVGVRRATEGRWERDEHSTENYITNLEEHIDTLEEKISKFENSFEYALSKSKVVAEFFSDIKMILTPAEFIFLCLRLAGYKYAAIQNIVGSVAQSDSTIQRKVELAKTKLTSNFKRETCATKWRSYNG